MAAALCPYQNKMKSRKRNQKILLWTIIGCLVAMLVLGLWTHGEAFWRWFLAHQPQNSAAAVAGMLAVYVVKCFLFVIPMGVLQLAASQLFTPPLAIAVNIAGCVIGFIVCYWMGHALGLKKVESFMERYPKAAAVMAQGKSRTFLVSFVARVVSFLPADIISMYQGASGAPFASYLTASTLGTLPSAVLMTLAGSSIRNPSSPVFWLSILLMILLAVGSILLSAWHKKRAKKNAGQE